MPDRIRVMRIIARLNIGGPAIHVCHLTAKLDPQRFESILVAGREAPAEGNMYHLAESLGVRPVFVETLGRELSLVSDWATLWHLVRLMRRHRPTIVHTHTAKAGAVGRVAAMLAGVPLRVHTFHGHTFHGYFGPTQTKVFLAIERWLARRTTRTIGVSRKVCDDLLELGLGTPASVVHIPLGLDLERFRDASTHRGLLRAQLGVDPGAPLVGMVARLVPIKRHDIFLRAAATVHEARPDVRFVLVGDGERHAAVRQLVSELGLESVVHLAGWREDLEVVYADLDLVALSSDNEGLPVALIEAMAAGRPVVATNVGGVPELVQEGENGYLVPPGDSPALARRMLDALGDRDRLAAMGATGRERAFASFTVDRLVRDVEALYDQLLREHAGC